MGAPVKVYAHSASQDCWNRKIDSRNEQKKKKKFRHKERESWEDLV